MDGLLADAKPLSDRLPGPALGPGIVNLHRLQDLDQAPQRGNRRQADRRVLATSCRSHVRHLVRAGTLHEGQRSLTTAKKSSCVDSLGAGVAVHQGGNWFVGAVVAGPAARALTRRAAAGTPAGTAFATKPKLARRMIGRALATAVPL